MKARTITYAILMLFVSGSGLLGQTLADIRTSEFGSGQANPLSDRNVILFDDVSSSHNISKSSRDEGEPFFEPIARIGLPMLAGIELMFLRPGFNKKVLYLSAAFETIVLVNKLSFGGSVFLPKSDIAVGVRANAIKSFVIMDKTSKVSYGTSFVMDYIFTNKTGLRMNFRLEMVLLDDTSVYPSLSVGFFDVFGSGK